MSEAAPESSGRKPKPPSRWQAIVIGLLLLAAVVGLALALRQSPADVRQRLRLQRQADERMRPFLKKAETKEEPDNAQP